ncbi:cytochrome b5 [Hymenobacter amundsenii]|uniref:Cytochrome b5 n=1 Tax=Hymenobacter amundsenii TaxID=2006685 RepID=A0A246FLL7_9BACT|nr:cytochrome b5 [Hymenobacter amundsenii]
MEGLEESFEPVTADGRPVAEQPLYTRSQLALRNGQDRDEIWVAYRGLIYDVTRSRLWKRGNHYEHWAGQDLTRELDQDAPHTPNVFDRFPVIGRL